MFKLKNVTKKYDDELALNDVSLAMGTGMNFIIGASGSGKSTLLKIISGIEKEFDGIVYYKDKDISQLTDKEKSYFYNENIGFIWQDFNLLEDLTVMENILLPCYLKEEIDINLANKILKELKLKKLEDKPVKFLSGGQKQRVAIARELMKTPEVILADEPTSALDKKTSKEIIDILRKISQTRTVIIVTHDISYITEKDNVYELDKGELISDKTINKAKTNKIEVNNFNSLSFNGIKNILKTDIIRHKGRFITSIITLILGIIFLLTSLSGGIEDSNNNAFDKLYNDYGESILDISIYKSFFSASGSNDSENDKPNSDVDQDIKGLYDKYSNDERVKFTTYLEPFSNIKIKYNDKNYSVTSSGNTPVINKLVAGRMPNGSGNEVVIPKSFVKKLGVTEEEILNREIYFEGEVVKWINDTPKYINVSAQVQVVGVMDTTIYSEFEGKIYDFEIEDSFLFSKSSLEEMLGQANMTTDDLNFLIRAKTPEDTISIKNELNKEGIVPLGRFELLEDIVNLNSKSTKGSSTGNSLIAILTIIMVGAIMITTNIMRKREYAIFKISGYNNAHLRKINLCELITLFSMSIITMTILSPILNGLTNSIFGVKVLSLKTIGTTIFVSICLTLFIYIIKEIICDTTNVIKALKSGEKD